MPREAQFLSADIVGVRLLVEDARTLFTPPDIEKGKLSLAFHETSMTEVRWEADRDGVEFLIVQPKVDASFKELTSSANVFTYSSMFEVRFKVTAKLGFDPQEQIPGNAVMPYLKMALWLSHQKAIGTFRNFGVTNFVWPEISAEAIRPIDVSKAKPRAARKGARKVAARKS